METLDFAVTMHPMEHLRSQCDNNRWVKVSHLRQHIGRRVNVAGIVRITKRTKTRQGQYMKFILLEDETGMVDGVLFPDAYQRWGSVLPHGRFLVIQGRVADDCGSLAITVERLEVLKVKSADFTNFADKKL